MALKILKFGGTSVANLCRMENVASIVKQQILSGDKIVVVVSAMAGITDQLVGYVKTLNHTPPNQDQDLVYSAGEQVTAGLLSIALNKEGIKSQSFLGWQVPIITDQVPTNAKIIHIDNQNLTQCLDQSVTPVIAGFQGVTRQQQITTLSRGGSDTTAVAIAAAMNADFCDIYTDVNGVYNCDPNLVKNAKIIESITYAEMLEMAANGAKVMQARSIEMAAINKVKVRVLSSFDQSNPKKHTLIQSLDNGDKMNKNPITAITHSQNNARIHFKLIPNYQYFLTDFFQKLSGERIIVDMVNQDMKCLSDGSFVGEVNFVCNQNDVEKIITLAQQTTTIPLNQIECDKNVAKISLIGIALRGNPEIIAKIFAEMHNNQIHIHTFMATEMRISIIVNQTAMEKAVKILHTSFGLDNKDYSIFDNKQEVAA